MSACSPPLIPASSVISALQLLGTGTTLNYFLDDGLNDAAILFPGLAAAAVATVFGAAAYDRSRRDRAETKAKLAAAEGSWADEQGRIPQGLDGGEVPAGEHPALEATGEAISRTAGGPVKRRRGIMMADHGKR